MADLRSPLESPTLIRFPQYLPERRLQRYQIFVSTLAVQSNTGVAIWKFLA